MNKDLQIAKETVKTEIKALKKLIIKLWSSFTIFKGGQLNFQSQGKMFGYWCRKKLHCRT
jgi:hypothetical protein